MESKSKSLSNFILPVSSTMVGVCMTVISLLQLAPKNTISKWADELVAINSLIFLVSAMLSYWALRHSDSTSAERYADKLFLVGMSIMVFVSFSVAFELFKH